MNLLWIYVGLTYFVGCFLIGLRPREIPYNRRTALWLLVIILHYILVGELLISLYPFHP